MSTGITRRIDELGRIVIPKEIRDELRIRTGDNLDILIDNESIILRKKSVLKSIKDISSSYIEVLYGFLKKSIIMIDNSTIIACSNDLKKKVLNNKISEMLYDLLNKKAEVLNNNFVNINIDDINFIESKYYYNPVVVNGDVIGGIVLLTDETITSEEIKIITLASKFLTKYLED